MKSIEDNGRPAIVINEHDEFGEPKTVIHCMDIDSARKLRDELTDTIKRCVVLEAVNLNKRGKNLGNHMQEDDNWTAPTPHAPGCKFLVLGGHAKCPRCLENENAALRDALGSLRDFVDGKRHDCENIAGILNGATGIDKGQAIENHMLARHGNVI